MPPRNARECRCADRWVVQGRTVLSGALAGVGCFVEFDSTPAPWRAVLGKGVGFEHM